MSFDLYVFDMEELPENDEAIVDLLEDDGAWNVPLTPALSQLVADLESRFPGLDDDPDGSPWASWPLTQSMVHGRCCAFNVVWSAAEDMSAEITAAATSLALKVYDPQLGSIIGAAPNRGSKLKSPRKWWRRS